MNISYKNDSSYLYIVDIAETCFCLLYIEISNKYLDLELTPDIIVTYTGGNHMTIKEVSEKYGITQDTLRYYERIGMIPAVGRTSGGIRCYQESDLGWVELAICMRNAGLPVEAMIEYVQLYQQGDSTLEARLELLQDQLDVLKEQQKRTQETIERLEHKISRYKKAVRTGRLTWDEPDCCTAHKEENKK